VLCKTLLHQDDEAVGQLQSELPKSLAEVPDSMCPVSLQRKFVL